MEFTAAQIAAFVGGAIDGDGNVRITNFAKIEEAGPSDLTFLANPK
ncbi:MAG: UDP-3-O-(3-hydroxymyristoyl)glucosamine N-acyltransferase, partial [Bacteroidales bacterium]|nr:UDP-3-O-(3-hydroxymyristoyl)glucosamine N-acyltransferase [Bacteroidales bacterium]